MPCLYVATTVHTRAPRKHPQSTLSAPDCAENPRWSLFLWWFLFLLVVRAQLVPAEAAEYRLQVVSPYEETFAYYLDADDHAASPLSRLESALDRQQISKRTILYDRWGRPAAGPVARAFGATPLKAEPRAGTHRESWRKRGRD